MVIIDTPIAYTVRARLYKDISYPGLRPQILASDKDSQTSALPTSLFFSHGRPSSVTTKAIRGTMIHVLLSLLVRHVIDGDYILQDFGGEDASYLSKEDFEKLQSGEEETSLEVGLKSWCVVKLE